MLLVCRFADDLEAIFFSCATQSVNLHCLLPLNPAVPLRSNFLHIPGTCSTLLLGHNPAPVAPKDESLIMFALILRLSIFPQSVGGEEIHAATVPGWKQCQAFFAIGQWRSRQPQLSNLTIPRETCTDRDCKNYDRQK
jgi:hypothetical protein